MTDSKISKKYYMIQSRDSGIAFNSILSISGFERTEDPNEAEFLLYDLNRWRNRPIREKFSRKPVFIYPHTPFTWWIWDGIYKTHKVSCNFVGSKASKAAMKAYGYPYRIEVCGFSRCEVKKWKPTEGRVLLYAPNHPITSMHKLRKLDKPITASTFKHVLEIAPAFDRVIIRYGHSLECSEIWDPKMPNVEFQLSDMTTIGSLASIDDADVVIAGQTLGYLAVARGKPTLFFNQKNVAPYETSGHVKSYEKYRWIDFPAQFEGMSAQNIIEFCKTPNEAVEIWKVNNIGKQFDVEKVLSVIREFVK
jgi:hypothetical protein